MSQVYGTTDVAATSRNAFVPYGIHAGDDAQPPIQLHLRQPEQQTYETSGSATR